MTNKKCAFFLFSTFFLAPSVLACEAPEALTVPNGATATEDEMADAGERFHQFMIDSQLYQACLEEEATRARRGIAEDDREGIRILEETLADRYNAASAAMKATAEEFDRAIATFRSRQ